MMKMIKARNILISPIKAVLSELDDNTADYILCSSEIDGIEDLGGSNVLGLEFLDTEMPDHFMRFTDIHAGKIRAFLTRPDANEDLFVCCDSGESRSSAIAAAILLAAGQDDYCIWESTDYHPNGLVFREMCRSLGIEISEGMINERKTLNYNAIHKAIENGQKIADFLIGGAEI